MSIILRKSMKTSKMIPHRTRLLIGYSNISSVDCANAISGRYMYDVAGSTCTNTSVDVCTDKNEVSFNYTYCTDVMAYSGNVQTEGDVLVWMCVYVVLLFTKF